MALRAGEDGQKAVRDVDAQQHPNPSPAKIGTQATRRQKVMTIAPAAADGLRMPAPKLVLPRAPSRFAEVAIEVEPMPKPTEQ